MKTTIKERPIWSTEQTKIIEQSIEMLNKAKRFAWECGINHIQWQTVLAKLKQQIKRKGHLLEAAMAFLFGYMNLPMRLSFTKEDDMGGADLVFRKTGVKNPLRIQLKWNNHNVKKYSADIIVVHVDNGMKPADIINQFQLTRILGTGWSKRITRDHLLMVHRVVDSISA